MPLRSEPVSRCLEKKTLIFGFEVTDLVLIFLIFSSLNVIFTGTGLELPLVWLPSAVVAIALRIAKRGKPDNYLYHLIRYHLKAKKFSAFPKPSKSPCPPQILRSNH